MATIQNYCLNLPLKAQLAQVLHLIVILLWSSSSSNNNYNFVCFVLSLMMKFI